MYYTISREYQQVIGGIRDGILRWMDRPGNEWMRCNFETRTAAAIYYLKLDDDLFRVMGAAHWLCASGFGQQVGAGQVVAAWEMALDQVTMLLCVPEGDYG